ncbi:hypothetical protein ALNOE001_04640 [Candidatus Methanobinarius endosymbioticus]|uniref:Uncharacterized protein n=1 Tax=Candidatus Methanobinarius endosymbioticus TaxID=2006182 RepID=A0A366MCY1_9EURY|nr:hypothetical protein ALNOE001_04640 [Candidatus Methanobinarius endosymbioticus]
MINKFKISILMLILVVFCTIIFVASVNTCGVDGPLQV